MKTIIVVAALLLTGCGYVATPSEVECARARTAMVEFSTYMANAKGSRVTGGQIDDEVELQVLRNDYELACRPGA